MCEELQTEMKEYVNIRKKKTKGKNEKERDKQSEEWGGSGARGTRQR